MVRLFLVFSFFLLPFSATAATLTRTGATDVNVNGTFYNVDFVTGTCAVVFNGCDDASDFALNAVSIYAAMFALERLINESPLIDADTRVTGCSERFQRDLCQIVTPYAEFSSDGAVKTAIFENYVASEDDADDFSFLCCVRPDTNLSSDGETFARWTRADEGGAGGAVIPLPSSAVLLITVFGGLAGAARHARRRASAPRHV